MASNQLRVLSLNCNGLSDPTKRNDLFNHLVILDPDIILLQETHTTPDHAARYKQEWRQKGRNHDSFWNSTDAPNANYSCGVAILLTDKYTTQAIDRKEDATGRIITLKVSHNHNTYQVQSVYAPCVQRQRPPFFNRLEEQLFPDGALIQGGDFNMVENPTFDRRGTTLPHHTKGLAELRNFKTTQHTADLWREKHQGSLTYTWSSSDGMIGARLDRFYLSTSLRTKFVRQEHLINPWSDHSYVILTIAGKPNAIRGAGYWKANVDHFKDRECVDPLTTFLTDRLNEPFEDIQDHWLSVKGGIKRFLVDHALRKKRQRSDQITSIQQFIDHENKKPKPHSDAQAVATAQEEMAYLKQSSFRGSMVRSREKVLIDGEKPNRYFYAKEAIMKESSTINQLRIGGTVVDERSKILEELHRYYSALYRKQDLDESLQDQLLSNIDVTLPGRIVRLLDRLIESDEVERAIDLAKLNRTPGLDGLPIEFYATFWPVLRDFLTKWANDVYNNGLKLGCQQRVAIITLIHKRKSRLDLDMWRPISLLCVDYKIVEKVLSLRLKRALPHILHTDQTCGVQGRTIFNNLYTIRDIITYANANSIPAYIVSLDFEKAFDKVDHGFLKKTLTAFGFPQKYVDFVVSSNENSVCQIINNGFFTRSVDITRSIKQGGQQSQQLFDLIAEVLAIALRKHPHIRGFRVPGSLQETKTSMYADDNTPILTTQHSFTHLYHLLEDFRRASGCNINDSKTAGITIGGAPIPQVAAHIQWNPPRGVRILGVQFHADPLMTQKHSWETVVEKMQNRASRMAPRRLSLKGRRILANTMLLSKAWHLATVIPAPMWAVRRINGILFDYLYNNQRPETIQRDILTLPLCKGGVGVLDFQLQTRSLRLNRAGIVLTNFEDSAWMLMTRYYTAGNIFPHHPEFAALAEANVPMYAGRPTDLPPYHRELPDFLRDHKEEYLRLNPATTHNIYQLLLMSRQPNVRMTGELYWQVRLGRHLNWARIWKNTFRTLDNNNKQDTLYKFLHNALPTGERLKSANGRYNTQCPKCGVLETPLHIFRDCPFAMDLMKKYMFIYNHHLTIQNCCSTDVLFTLYLPRDQHQQKLILTITTSIMHEIWRARCEARFDNVAHSVQLSTRRINSYLSMVHKTYFIEHTDFENVLCLPSAVCCLYDGQLVFNWPI